MFLFIGTRKIYITATNHTLSYRSVTPNHTVLYKRMNPENKYAFCPCVKSTIWFKLVTEIRGYRTNSFAGYEILIRHFDHRNDKNVSSVSHLRILILDLLNTLRPRQNGRHFPDDIFKWIFLNENVWISINISLKYVPRGPINNIPTLVQVMAWRRPGDKPLSEPMMVRLPTHICITRPHWVLTDAGLNKMATLQATFRHVHYNDVMMGPIASQITSLTIVYSIVYSDADQRKHQSSASLVFVRGIHRWPVNFPHKWPVTRKMFPLDDCIMILSRDDVWICSRILMRYVVSLLGVGVGWGWGDWLTVL